MEINARVYAVATDEKLLEQVHQILAEKTYHAHMFSETLTPCAVLPLQQTWYGFTEETEMTNGPESWMTCLQACAQVLMKNEQWLLNSAVQIIRMIIWNTHIQQPAEKPEAGRESG